MSCSCLPTISAPSIPTRGSAHMSAPLSLEPVGLSESVATGVAIEASAATHATVSSLMRRLRWASQRGSATSARSLTIDAAIA
jgi:hypothetical protein